jgi:hypothetical protein
MDTAEQPKRLLSVCRALLGQIDQSTVDYDH